MNDTELLQALLREQVRTNELLEAFLRQGRPPAPAARPAPPPPNTLDRDAINQEYAAQLKNALAGGGPVRDVVNRYYNSIGVRR